MPCPFRSCAPRILRCALRLSRTKRLLHQDDRGLVEPQGQHRAYRSWPPVERRDQDASSGTGYVTIAVGRHQECPSYDTIPCFARRDTWIQRCSPPSPETETVSNPCPESDRAYPNTSDREHESAESEGCAPVLTGRRDDRLQVLLGGHVLPS